MRIGRWIAAGLGLAAIGAAAVYAQYRNTEEPEYALLRGVSAQQAVQPPPGKDVL